MFKHQISLPSVLLILLVAGGNLFLNLSGFVNESFNFGNYNGWNQFLEHQAMKLS
jgi:hypothetical protein